MRLRGALVAAILRVLLVPSPDALAQDLEPRSYANTPRGMSFLLVGYAYSTGGVALDASVPLDDGEIDIHTEVFAFVHSFALFGKSAKIDVIVPVAELSGSATFAGETVERNVEGLGDQRIRFSWNFFGAPSLRLPEHLEWRQDLILGASLQVIVPGGQYDDERIVNLGSNRWGFKPEIGLSKAIDRFTLELSAAVTVYTDNHDWLETKTREQDPLFAAQWHGIYSLPRGIWAALDLTYYAGGRSSVDGDVNADAKNNIRMGGTIALPITRHQSLKLFASGALLTAAGTDFTNVGIFWQYRWGGGL